MGTVIATYSKRITHDSLFPCQYVHHLVNHIPFPFMELGRTDCVPNLNNESQALLVSSILSAHLAPVRPSSSRARMIVNSDAGKRTQVFVLVHVRASACACVGMCERSTISDLILCTQKCLCAQIGSFQPVQYVPPYCNCSSSSRVLQVSTAPPDAKYFSMAVAWPRDAKTHSHTIYIHAYFQTQPH